jgi:hypothetical protein
MEVYALQHYELDMNPDSKFQNSAHHYNYAALTLTICSPVHVDCLYST